ncbi:LytTR family DNA-binding domain-containing protein [Carboxylicivirga sp. M1479]|uniref:LytTR family DNA-binding domain-containing protein n=1 Tax=Carboxylicivirga sp. M1479 TaxID=2594476 RepID=UPI001177A8CE|nr:LytTR family DNA-binding domain-containing protein [Carboxylicivirga sp. M1479]TRX63986.1 LytTR family transcriptional regulator [Carboxylicivirga sp. M1479]
MKKSTLILECQNQVQRIKCQHIVYLQYQQGAIRIWLNNNTQKQHSKSLRVVEQSLPDNFVKINRNVIINLHYLSAYFKTSQKVVLENGVEFDVSRRNASPLLGKILLLT